MIKMNETTSSTWRTNLEPDIVLRYSGKTDLGNEIEFVGVNILKNELNLGSASVDRDGSMSISLYKGFTVEERESVLASIVRDTDEIFNSKSE